MRDSEAFGFIEVEYFGYFEFTLIYNHFTQPSVDLPVRAQGLSAYVHVRACTQLPRNPADVMSTFIEPRPVSVSLWMALYSLWPRNLRCISKRPFFYPFGSNCPWPSWWNDLCLSLQNTDHNNIHFDQLDGLLDCTPCIPMIVHLIYGCLKLFGRNDPM